MPKHRLVISVTGGVVDDVLTDALELEVILCDWDVDGLDDRDIPQLVQFTMYGQRHSALVAPFQAAALPSSPNSLVGTALKIAGLSIQDEPLRRQLSERELATMLAALRYWQNDLAEDGVESVVGGAHFQEHEPLNLYEIDDLCERLNQDETGPSEHFECQQPG